MSSRRLRLLAVPEQTCSYLPDRSSRSLFIDPDARMDAATYAGLLAQGFRRSGQHVYRPGCRGCRACQPTRIPVPVFSPNRAQRRCRRRNADLVATAVTRLDDEHAALYARYQRHRHTGGPMQTDSIADIEAFLCCDWLATELREFRLNGELLAVSATDRVPGALSAVYSFFDPDRAERSLGRYCVLDQVERACELGLDHLYLGYTVAGCRKMAYKAEYRPAQVHDGRGWVDCPDGVPLDPVAGPDRSDPATAETR